MCVLASSDEVSITVISGAPAAAVSPAIERPVGDDAVDGAANLGVVDLRFGALVLAFGRCELALAPI